MSESIRSSRRRFLKAGVATAAGVVLPGWTLTKGAPAIIAAESERPQALQGLQFGDPGNGSVVVWSRSDRAARMLVEWSYDEQFQDVHRLVGPHALDTTDFTARQDLEGLEPGSEVFVRVSFQSLNNARAIGEPVTGRFIVPPDELIATKAAGTVMPAAICAFVWGGDTAGQGWGINPGFGGMKIYEAMRQRRPLFFIHSGDTIYADGPIAESVVAENGQVWNNIVTPQVAKVAETLDEFRGRYRYNLLDENVRRFNAEVPQIWQWDDHEVANNWSDSKDLSADARYTRKERAAARRARRAGVSRVCADAALRRARIAARLPALQLRPAARALRARHAVVPRSQFGQPADDAERRDRVSRSRAVGLAEGGSEEFTRGVEGRGRRHAARSECR